MRMYRVQNADGDGPYQGQSFPCSPLYEMVRAHSREGKDEHPTPQDEDWRMDDEHRSCFISLVQLRAWFSPAELLQMYEAGFSVVEIEGSLLWESARQAVTMDDFTVVRTLSFGEAL